MAVHAKPKRQMGQVTGAAALGTAVTTIVLWILNLAWGLEVDEAVQGAITTIVVLLAGWAVPPKEPEVIESTETIEVEEPEEVEVIDEPGVDTVQSYDMR